MTCDCFFCHFCFGRSYPFMRGETVFGVLNILSGGILRGAPKQSCITLQKCLVGPIRYYEVDLMVGRDGPAAATSLLYEQIIPFMSPRLLCRGSKLDGVDYFSPNELVKEILLNTALKVSCYMGGVASIISPYQSDIKTAERFLPFCSEVRFITPAPLETDSAVEVCNDISALEDSTVVVCLSGLTGVARPDPKHLRHTAIFTNTPQYFDAGLLIDGVLPRLPAALSEIPFLIDRLTFAGACYSLCGMFGIAGLTPLRIYSGKKAVSFDDIVSMTTFSG